MTLDEAIVALVDEFSISDSVYDVRERTLSDSQWYRDNPDASGWDHPKVKRFSDAVTALEQRANEVKNAPR